MYSTPHRASSGALVLLASMGLVMTTAATPGQAERVTAAPPQGDRGLAPLIEPDPETVVVRQGDDAVDGLGVRITQHPERVAGNAAEDSVERAGRNGANIVNVKPQLSPGHAKKYGVAQVVTMRFPVSINRQKAVERSVTIEGYRNGKMTQPVALPQGRWGWVDGRTAVYRPKRFWPGDTTIRFTVNLKGIVVSELDGTRYEGSKYADFIHEMRIGRKLVLKIRDSKHRLKVSKGGKTVKTFGVSLGKRNFRTYSGIKVLSDIKYRKLRMVGNDKASQETWDVISPYSMPLTTDGEYIHGAPWARYRIGSANGSHGCTNMNPEDARWLYNRVREGDPVVTKGTGRSMTPAKAYTAGKPWAYSWKKWKKKSYFFK